MNPKNPNDISVGDIVVFDKSDTDYRAFRHHHQECSDRPHRVRTLVCGSDAHPFLIASVSELTDERPCDAGEHQCYSNRTAERFCDGWYAKSLKIVAREAIEDMKPDPFFAKP